MIYLILAPEVDRIKIGRSVNVESRLKGLQTGHSQELCLVMTADKPDNYEAELHDRFKTHNVRGEWFEMCPDIARFVLFNFGWKYGPDPRPCIASAFACLKRHCPGEFEQIIKAYRQITEAGLSAYGYDVPQRVANQDADIHVGVAECQPVDDQS